jgi:hypothetical protein
VTRLVARVVTWLALAAVIAVAGGHFVYYLFQWEWGRAAIAGTGFTAALVVGSTFLFLNRVQRIEQRLDRLLELAQSGPAASPDGLGRETVTDIEPRPDFPWLSSASPQALGILALVAYEPPREAVFIPVFLAAGLVISAAAGLVERVAALRYRDQTVTAPTSTPRSAARGAASTRELLASRPRRSLIAFPLIGVLITGLAVGGLYLVSHYWSKPIGPGITTMTVEVRSRGPTYPDVQVVETAGRYCSINSGIGVRYLGVRAGPGETTLLRLAPLLDGDAQRRFRGCLEDAFLEWHSLDVTSTELHPR